MKKINIPVLLAVLVSGISSAAYAEFNLDKLKAIADKAKAYQEKINQGAQTPPPPSMPSENGAGQTGNGMGNASNTVDQASVMAAREKWDVVGVRMGMSLDEALRALRTHNPKLKVSDIQGQRFIDADNKKHPVLYFLSTGERPRASEKIYLTLSLPPQQRVVHIDREISYSKNEASTYAAVLDSLQKKYGQTLVKPSGNYDDSLMEWFAGGRGQPNNPTSCTGYSLRKPGWNLGSDAQALSRKGCAMLLTARVGRFTDNPALVSGLFFSLDDNSTAYQDLVEAEKYFGNAAKIKDDVELDNARRKTAPKI